MNMISEIINIFKKYLDMFYDKELDVESEQIIRTDLIRLLVDKQDIIIMTREGRAYLHDLHDLMTLLNRGVKFTDSSPDITTMPKILKRREP